MPKYVVETVSMFRMRYVVECINKEDAKDSVTMHDIEEFGQQHLGENIVGVREVTDSEIVDLFIEDHPYLSDNAHQLAFNYIHKVDYNI